MITAYVGKTAISAIPKSKCLGAGQPESGHGQTQRPDGGFTLLALTGAGSIDMPGKQCDMALNVRVTGGWQGRGELIEQLQKRRSRCGSMGLGNS